MATQKYRKVRIGQGIGSQLGVLSVRFSSLFWRPIAPDLVQVWEKKLRKRLSDLWADFPRVALPTRARCGLHKIRFFYRALSGVCDLFQSRYQARFH
jgi:hypothetical protein